MQAPYTREHVAELLEQGIINTELARNYLHAVSEYDFVKADSFVASRTVAWFEEQMESLGMDIYYCEQGAALEAAKH